MSVTTNSTDPTIKLMAEGLKESKPCQWQEIYFVGYSVVRVDRVMMKQDLPGINWLNIYNSLTMAFYKVFMTQSLVKPSEAIDPTKKLSDGWKMGIVTRNNVDQSAVAYRPIGIDSGFYQVSFVKFTRWKTGTVAQIIKRIF